MECVTSSGTGAGNTAVALPFELGSGGCSGDGSSSGKSLPQQAADTYGRTCLLLPGIVRQWAADCSRNTATKAERHTAHLVSPAIISAELESVMTSYGSGINPVSGTDAPSALTVKGSKMSREITALYTVEDIVVEMVLSYPVAYPLKPIALQVRQQCGVSEGRWRKWLLSMTTLLHTQNSSTLG